MPDVALDLLRVTPAIGPSIFQPKNRRGCVWRLSVPPDCELVETALNPVIGRLFSEVASPSEEPLF
jgi:hypothetical protein